MEGIFEVGGEGTDDGACVSTYMLGGSGACSPRNFFFQIRCSEIAFEAILVIKLSSDINN